MHVRLGKERERRNEWKGRVGDILPQAWVKAALSLRSKNLESTLTPGSLILVALEDPPVQILTLLSFRTALEGSGGAWVSVQGEFLDFLKSRHNES